MHGVAFDFLFEVFGELLQDGFDDPIGAVGEAADGGAGHDALGEADFHEQVEVLGAAAAFVDAVDDLVGPGGAFAAGGALAAGFVGVEADAVTGDGDHVGGVVHHRHAGGAEAEDAIFFADVEIERSVVLIGAEDAHGDAAMEGGFVFAFDAAGVFFDELAHRDTEFFLVAAGLVAVAGDAHELGAGG